MEQILTTEEAATRLGVTSARVRAMIIAGKLPSQKFGHVHMIKGEDLKLVEDRQPGRPPKVKINGTAKKAEKKKAGKK